MEWPHHMLKVKNFGRNLNSGLLTPGLLFFPPSWGPGSKTGEACFLFLLPLQRLLWGVCPAGWKLDPSSCLFLLWSKALLIQREGNHVNPAFQSPAIYSSCFSNTQYFALSFRKLLKLKFQLTSEVSAVTIGELICFMKWEWTSNVPGICWNWTGIRM